MLARRSVYRSPQHLEAWREQLEGACCAGTPTSSCRMTSHAATARGSPVRASLACGARSPTSRHRGCGGSPADIDAIHTRMCQHHHHDGAIPFVIPRPDAACAVVGIAATEWAIDLLRWAYTAAPLRQQHRILGLLLGVLPAEIASHDAGQFAGIPLGTL